MTMKQKFLKWLLEAEQTRARHAVHVLAGVSVTLGLLPCPSGGAAPSGRQLVLTGLVLICVLLLIGPVLNSMQSLFVFLGTLPGWIWPVAAGLLVVDLLRRKGRRYLVLARKAIA